MSGFLGADTEQLREHAQRVKERSQRLIELRDQLTPMVMDESIWRGPDADAFRQRWSGETAPQFDQRQHELGDRGGELERHAEEQDTVSSEDGGAGGGADGGGDKPFSPFSFLKDLAIKGQALYSKSKALVDFLKRIGPAASEYGALASRGLKDLWKASYLDELFKGGKGWQSAAEKLLGKLGLPTSIGNFSPLKHLNKLDDVAPWLKTTGSVLGKALPFVDVAFGIEKIATSDNWYDRTSGILGTAGGALLIAAPFTGPAAPVVAAIGTGLGVVSAGMDLGKLVYENWDGITSTVSNAASTVGDAIGNAGHAIGNAASTVGSAVSDGIGRLKGLFG